MPSPTRTLPALAVALSILAQGARADDSNFRPYAVGSRAAGMGGAFTGLADDGSGPFYNPGGVAFTRRSQLSLSGSVYGIVRGTFEDALGDGHDFSYQNLNVFPTATSAVWKLGAPEAAPANVVALSVFVPDAFNADDRDTLGSKQNAFFLSSQVQTVWMGMTYARRMGPVGVGATGFFLLGTRLQQLDFTLAPSGQFGTISSRVDESTQGFVGALGIRWDVTERLHLGASVYSPAVGWGSRRVFVRGVAAPTAGEPQMVVENEDHLHASPTEPLRAQAGAAFTAGPLTLTADVIFLAARDLTDDVGALFERRVVRKPVTNFAAGIEYVLSDRFPLRAGFFTDFAASRSPPDASVENTSHVDRFGGTFSVGYRSEHTSTDLGLNVSGGSGQDLVPRNLDFSDLKVTGSSQLLLYVFLATSYEF